MATKGKFSVTFFVQKRKGYKEGNIRARVACDGWVSVLSVGHNWSPEKWRNGFPKPNTTNASGLTAKELTAVLADFTARARSASGRCSGGSDFRSVMRGGGGEGLSARRLAEITVRERRVSAGMERMYYQIAKMIDGYCKGGLTARGVRAWLVEVSGSLASSSFNIYRMIAGSLLRTGERHGLIGGAEFPPTEKVPGNEPLFLMPEEVARIGSLRMRGLAEEVRKRFLLQCHTGLRLSDVASVTRECIFGGALRVRVRKTGEVVEVPLTDTARELAEGFVAPMASVSGYNVAVREICREAGVNGGWEKSRRVGGRVVTKRGERWEFATSHTGRKTFVCNCIAAGVHINVIMAMTGHRDFASVKPYLNVSLDTKARGVDALWRLMSEAVGDDGEGEPEGTEKA